MTVLIVEGCDLSGKTTAIEKINKKFKDGFLLKNLYKPSDSKDIRVYEQYWKILNFISQNNDIPIFVLDRFYPSQAVYSYLRGSDDLELREMSDNTGYIAIEELDKYCSSRKFLFVLLDTPLDVLKERYAARGDEHISIEDLETLYKRYNEFYEKTNLEKIKVDTRSADWLDKIAKKVQEMEEKHGEHNRL